MTNLLSVKFLYNVRDRGISATREINVNSDREITAKLS